MFRRYWGYGLAAILLFGLLAALRFLMHAKFEARLEEIRQTGMPVTLEELNASYKEPPKDENAAELYGQAFTRLRPAPGTPILYGSNQWLISSGAPKPPWEKLSDENRKKVAAYIEDNSEALDILHRASKLRKSRYPLDMTKGPFLEVPHISKARESARLLQVQVFLYLNDGRPDLAVQSTINSFGLARSLEEEPVLISSLVRFACLSITIRDIERILNRSALVEDQLKSLQSELEQAAHRGNLKLALNTERCGFVDYARHRGARAFLGPDASEAQKAGLFLMKTSGWMDIDLMHFLNLTSEAIAITDTPDSATRLVAAKTLDGKVSRLPRYCVISRLLMPSISGVFQRSAWMEADLQSARTAVAIERYRLREKKLPDRLEQLMPAYLSEIPCDPFDGKPLRYKRVGKGYIVYSAGRDLVDDGGDNTVVGYAPRDIIFSVGIIPEGLGPTPPVTEEPAYRHGRRVRLGPPPAAK